MAHRKTLTAAQVELLRWIADRCPDGVMTGTGYRVSAAALRNRGLVITKGHGPTWSAKITAKGEEYLTSLDGPGAPAPRQANVSVTEQLIEDLLVAGGSLCLPANRWPRTGVDYEARARAAERHGKVPEGKRIEVRHRSGGTEVQIDLVDAPPGTTVPLVPVTVPARVGRYHHVVQEYRADADDKQVSRAVLPRVLRILHGLIVKAEQSGFAASFADGRAAKDGDVVFAKDGHTCALRILEEGLPTRSHWKQQNRRYLHYGTPALQVRYPPRSEYEVAATGRLRIELPKLYRTSRTATWADRRRWTLEDKLPEVLRELEVRVAEHLHEQLEREREAAARQVAWEAALEQARDRHATHQRAQVLLDEVERWETAERIRSYCDAAIDRYPNEPVTAAWVAWARQHAFDLDPLTDPPSSPPDPVDVPEHDLQAFLPQGIRRPDRF